MVSRRSKPKGKAGWKWIVGSVLLCTILAEFVARFMLGLGSPLLYEVSPDYGYRVVPNQDIRRFGNRLFYNAEGLRSKPISAKPALGTIRILCVGDSITYGGAQTDQAQTYPYLLQNILEQLTGKRFEVLNASAGAWAPANEEAYLEHHGIYHSQLVLLQVGSNDLFQAKASSDLVGRHPSFPDRKPILALEDGFFRYFLPKYLPAFVRDPGEQIPTPTRQDSDLNLEIVTKLHALVKHQKARLIVFFIEQPDELEPQDALHKLAKALLVKRLAELHVPFISLAEAMRKSGGKRLFRDEMHPNAEGNQVMAEVLAEFVSKQLAIAN